MLTIIIPHLTVIAIRAFLSRRLQFHTLLRGSQTGLTTSRYLRLIAVAMSDIIVYVPFACYDLSTFTKALVPWGSWSTVHSDFGYVGQWDSSYWAEYPTQQLSVFLLRWAAVLPAIAFFASFGLAEDALKEYAQWWMICTSCVRSRKPKCDNHSL